MPRVKIVVYRDKLRLYLDGHDVPLSRLPDLVPIYIDTVNTDSGGAVVLEGHAWYGIEDDVADLLTDLVDNDIRRRPTEPARVVTSRSGNLTIEEWDTYVVLRVRYRDRVYRETIRKDSALAAQLNPFLLTLRLHGNLDRDFLSFIANELRDEEVRRFLRELQERSSR